MAVNPIKEGYCNWCGKKCGVFKDELSRREYSISALCQECQDKIFIDPDEERYEDDAEEYERNQLTADGYDG